MSVHFNRENLRSALIDYPPTISDEYARNIDQFIAQAETVVLRDLGLEIMDVVETLSPSGVDVVDKPESLVSERSAWLVVGGEGVTFSPWDFYMQPW